MHDHGGSTPPRTPHDGVPVHGTPPGAPGPDPAQRPAGQDATRHTFGVDPAASPGAAMGALLMAVLVAVGTVACLVYAPAFTGATLVFAGGGALVVAAMGVFAVRETRDWRAERFEVTPDALVHVTRSGTRRVPWHRVVRVARAQTGPDHDRTEWQIFLDDDVTVVAVREHITDALELVRLVEQHAGLGPRR